MKTILITGANRGLGFELAKQYLAEGWHVIACCREPEHADHLQSLKNTSPANITIYKMDVANPQDITQVSQQLNNQAIDVLINNAGVIGSHTDSLQHLDQAVWLDTFKINAIAPAFVTQAFVNHVSKSQLKLIVNISSTMGSISANSEGGYYIYRSSKAALNSVTKCLSIELKPKGITVISMHPGWVQTDMGGAQALLLPEESIAGMRRVISKLSINDTGAFLSYDGSKLAW